MDWLIGVSIRKISLKYFGNKLVQNIFDTYSRLKNMSKFMF